VLLNSRSRAEDYNKLRCRTPSWHRQTVHTTHCLIFFSDNTPTQNLMEFPVHCTWKKLHNSASCCSLTTPTTTLTVYRLLTEEEEKPIYRIFKAVPIQVWSGPEDSRKLRFPDTITMAQDGGRVVSLMHWPTLPPANPPGTQIRWRLSRPQHHTAIGRILCQ